MVVDDVISWFKTVVPGGELSFEAHLDVRALASIDQGYPTYEILPAQDKAANTELQRIAIGAGILSKIHQVSVGSRRAWRFDMLVGTSTQVAVQDRKRVWLATFLSRGAMLSFIEECWGSAGNGGNSLLHIG